MTIAKKISKKNQSYTCTECGHQAIKWLGCCPTCKNWNTFDLEEVSSRATTIPRYVQLKHLDGITDQQTIRYSTHIKEWDRVLGGGMVPGSFLIITGDPGIGKSTLLLQVAHALAQQYTVFYFTSEESLEQVKLRAQRIHCVDTHLWCAAESNLDTIIATIAQKQANTKPAIVIIDSIQNCFTQDITGTPGSMGQLKDAAFKLMKLAKEQHIAIIVTGHITKEGVMAGPKIVEHMVDGVFYLQGEDRWQTRVLRAVKNRFGTIAELGFFQMGSIGLEEMPNINQYLLQEVTHNPGSALISFIEGTRPLLIELQALVLGSKYNIPQRVISGIDQTQVVLIASILEKYLQIKLNSQDIFFKISGSFKVKTSGADLGIALALLSSYFQKPLPTNSLALGELSLTGHIKPTNHAMIHINEAQKFGITTFLLAYNQQIDNEIPAIKLATVHELLQFFN